MSKPKKKKEGLTLKLPKIPRPIKALKERTEKRKLLILKLVDDFSKPVKGVSPLQTEIDNYHREICKLSYKKLLHLDGLKKYKLRLDVLDVCGGISGKLADDFLEDVFQRHQSLDVAILVDGKADTPMFALKIQQLPVQ